MNSVITAVRKFRGLRVLVVGDAMLDCYYLGTATRISPEGPIPVVRSTGRIYLPGGAANTAANAAALGANVRILSVVGTDHEADILRCVLKDLRVDTTSLVVDRMRPTTTKVRIVADGHILARFDEEQDADVTGHVADDLLATFRALFADSDVIIVSDYMKGVVFPGLVSELAAMNRDRSRLVVVDSKDLSRHSFHNVSVITPNHIEAHKTARVPLPLSQCTDSLGCLESVGRSLLEQVGTRWALVTIGGGGAVLFERDRPVVRIQAREVRSPEVVGAGDSLTAALALALGAGLPIAEAARVAVESASIAVSKPLTAAVKQHELLQRLSMQDGVELFESISDRIGAYRKLGKKIVLTNGEFDGLHSGHIAFLREARRLGDVLLVGVNSDRSMRRRTGRPPLLPQQERLSVVAALDSVDHAILFDEETPGELIRRVRPDIHVKGGDYEGEDLPEQPAVEEVGARLVILPLQGPITWPPADRQRTIRNGRRRTSLAIAGRDSEYKEIDTPEEAAS